jgi:hypothetical protein
MTAKVPPHAASENSVYTLTRLWCKSCKYRGVSWPAGWIISVALALACRFIPHPKFVQCGNDSGHRRPNFEAFLV